MKRIVTTVMLVLLLLLLNVRLTFAHGADSTPQVVNALVGSYRLSVWTTPGVLRPGEIHVEALVTDARGAPMPDCIVRVAIAPLAENREPVVKLARPAAVGSVVVEEAAFDLKQPGDYRVVVAVADSMGSVGETAFTIQVQRVPVAVQGLIYLLLGASLLMAVWTFREVANVWFRE